MAPNLFGNSAALYLEASQQANFSQDKPVSGDQAAPAAAQSKPNDDKKKYQWKIVWRNVIAFIYLHVGAVYGLYLCVSGAKFLTVLWCEYIIFFCS